mmetsp:Transcript_101669/g.328071  ORF Transcript_101669/g.328071 Transcript_101669/m.328071 type:complete len:315 (-) Transcript_101669:1152-2096(-)
MFRRHGQEDLLLGSPPRQHGGLSPQEDGFGARCEQDVLVPEAHASLAREVLPDPGPERTFEGGELHRADEPSSCRAPHGESQDQPPGAEAALVRGAQRWPRRPRGLQCPHGQLRQGPQDGASGSGRYPRDPHVQAVGEEPAEEPSTLIRVAIQPGDAVRLPGRCQQAGVPRHLVKLFAASVWPDRAADAHLGVPARGVALQVPHGPAAEPAGAGQGLRGRGAGGAHAGSPEHQGTPRALQDVELLPVHRDLCADTGSGHHSLPLAVRELRLPVEPGHRGRCLDGAPRLRPHPATRRLGRDDAPPKLSDLGQGLH